MAEDNLKTTLYVGDLSASVTEEQLHFWFSFRSDIKSMVIYKRSSLFAFIDYYDHEGAASTLAALNGTILLGRKMKVEWASDNARRKDYVIFVGDLCSTIDAVKLGEAFATFGEISDGRIIVDLETLKSRYYGFVYFIEKADAQKAITEMNGQCLGSIVFYSF
ncbi:nucleolysin TIAR-like [Macrosteles quadrilineatus]|uniref:nucleolysin TIAR-like n=1 Tax=Macrosteles quadrilineatus TaxID=74068 RepID=UPI0023E15BEB|nr:nucleolysin TIAR-like [Macrosteles quadrilineatus]